MLRKTTGLLAVALIVALPLKADEETVGEYAWTYGVSGDTAEITAVSPSPTNAVAIPSALGGRTVTSIGARALYGSKGLTGVTIPDSVASIGEKAFYGCSVLTDLTIGDGVTNIGTSAFTGCRKLERVTIPQYVCSSSMKRVFPSAYTSITHVAISPGVTHLANDVFKGCPDSIFDTATIPGVMLVDGWAVGNAGTLSGALDLTGVRGIGGKAFYKCVDLTGAVVIPDGVAGIGDAAFYGCTGITGVTISASVLHIGDKAFSGCKGLTGSVEIPDGVARIGEYAFYGCRGVTGVTIPASVADVGDKAFSGCKGLAHIIFKGDAPSMGESTFASVGSGCLVSVKRDSAGWGVAIPGTWNGMKIAYLEEGTTYAGTLDTGFARAQTVRGAVVLFDRDYTRVGTMQVKVGKINKKRRAVRLSAVATLLVDGKMRKTASAAVTATLDAQGRIPPVALTFKDPVGKMTFEMAQDGAISLKNAVYAMAEAAVGGALKGGARGAFRLGSFKFDVPGDLQEDLLPYEEAFEVVGNKWKFAKASSVKWVKDRETKEFIRVVDVSKGKTNRSSLKINYQAKTGLFKGSFKAYALENAAGGKKRLRKYTVNVVGFVVDGLGFGSASGKRSAGGPWPVTVE